MDIDLTVTKKQREFINNDCDEVLYGGAAGGGKSYGQIIDSFIKAMTYPGIKQLILRTSFPELERSLIMVALQIIPNKLYKYNASKHVMTFINGSRIEFGYLSNDSAVTMYQSAEYDIIRFDELTHFSEYQYTYMASRIRGVNKFPKQLKSSTNPGSKGHAWVKERFIDVAPPYEVTIHNERTRIFIPAKVQDNTYLMENDPSYVKRLESLGENERKALLHGEWDIFEGQYFPEFKREVHVIEPFEIPKYWKRFRGMDYGLDMCACLWCAIDVERRVYVYRELCEPNLTLSSAAEKINSLTLSDENIQYTAASPDLWNRRQDSGVSGIEIMTGAGFSGLYKADNRRIPGWRNMREYLKETENGARLYIFKNCINLIKSIPALIHDERNVEDASSEPHEFTHSPEALRYALMTHPITYKPKEELKGRYTKTELEDMKDKTMAIRRR
mgnify:CR=1 FL=1